MNINWISTEYIAFLVLKRFLSNILEIWVISSNFRHFWHFLAFYGIFFLYNEFKYDE